MIIDREMLDNHNFDIPDLIDTVLAAWEENARLQAENKRLQTRLDHSRSANRLRQRRLDAAVAARDQFREKLKQYGKHGGNCDAYYGDRFECTCGFNTALEGK